VRTSQRMKTTLHPC